MYSPAQWFDLTLVGNSGGQVFLNKFYYGVGELDLPYTGSILDPAEDFENIVLPGILGVCSNAMNFTEIIVNEHVSGLATAVYPLPPGTAGALGGDPAPCFVAWAFKSTRVSRAVPSAHKRFGRCSESSIIAGAADASIITALNALAVDLAKPFTATNGGMTDLQPLSISRRDNSVPPSTPRPVPLFEDTNNWVYQKVTSQVSRRP